MTNQGSVNLFLVSRDCLEEAEVEILSFLQHPIE